MDGAASFDSVAELYDEARPGYPESLIEAALEASGIPDGGRILEVGAGTGQASRPFAARGYRMTCLEPGPALASLARRKLASWPRVRVACATFEDWRLEPGAYDLAISAQAFHWVDPEVGYAKVARALVPGGALALFWNLHDDEADASEARRALDRAYVEHAPELSKASLGRRLPDIEGRIAATGLFGPVARSDHRWSAEYDRERYLKLLQTHSDHIALQPERRARLLDAIGAVIDRLGGHISRPMVANLYVARREA